MIPLSLIFHSVLILSISQVHSSDKVVRARVESCPGCQLNRLSEVRAFVYEDVPKYEDVEFKKIPGHPPELVFVNEDDKEIERIDLKGLNRKECNSLLEKNGFKQAAENKEL